VKSSIFLALLILVGFLLASCKAPDQAASGPKDSTSKMEKQAGGDE
jgi:hypothetical protein